MILRRYNRNFTSKHEGLIIIDSSINPFTCAVVKQMYENNIDVIYHLKHTRKFFLITLGKFIVLIPFMIIGTYLVEKLKKLPPWEHYCLDSVDNIRNCLIVYLKVSIYFFLIASNIIINKTYTKIIIHSFWTYPAGYIAVLLKKIFPNRIKGIVVNLMGYDHNIYTYKNKGLRTLTSIVMKYADVLITGEETSMKQVVKLYSGSETLRKTVGIPPSINETFYEKAENAAKDFIDNKTVIKILVTPKFKKDYGAIEIINSLKYLDNYANKVRKKIVFIITGETDDDLLKKLLKKSKELNNIKAIYIGIVPNFIMKKLYDEANVALYLSYYAHGISAIEAMARGTPVIAWKTKYNRIKHKITGYLLNERDGKKLASAIVELLDNKELAKKISHNATNYSRRFRSPVIAMYYKKIHEILISFNKNK